MEKNQNQNQNQNQIQNKEDKKITIEVHMAEYELLKRIREKYQFGEMVIEVRDGLPCRIRVETKFEKLWF